MELAALAQCAGNADTSSVRSDDRLDDRETKTRAATISGINLPKAMKDPL
jgi:hypothetical protein